MRVEANDPRRAGALASERERFGPFGRYLVAAVHTRFDAVEWMVSDAELPDPVTGLPSIIRQEPTRERAMDFDHAWDAPRGDWIAQAHYEDGAEAYHRRFRTRGDAEAWVAECVDAYVDGEIRYTFKVYSTRSPEVV